MNAVPTAGWRKASRSTSMNDKCVEMHRGAGLVRDSKNSEGPALSASILGLVAFARDWSPAQ